MVNVLNLEFIKYLRKESKLSQEEAAIELGFTSLYQYHRKESGIQSFTAEELFRISNYYRVPLINFFISRVAKNAI